MCGNVFQSHTCEILPHLLAISSGHNTQQREQSPRCPDSLDCSSAFIAAEEKASLQCFIRVNAALSLSCPVSFVSAQSLQPITHCPHLYLSAFPSPAAIPLALLVCLFITNLPITTSGVFFYRESVFLSSILKCLSPICLQPNFFPPSSFCLPEPSLPTVIYLCHSTSIPKPCSFCSPRQAGPPVSSLGGHQERRGRRSDNPLTPHLSSERGKAPS